METERAPLSKKFQGTIFLYLFIFQYKKIYIYDEVEGK